MILLLSIKNDSHTDAVISAISKIGGGYIRLDTDKFADITVSFHTGGGKIILPGEILLDISEIGSIWGRRRFLPDAIKNVDKAYQAFAESQWVSFSSNIWMLLREKKWLNHPDMVEQAKHKIFQLQVAEKLGFNIPKTVFTNTLSSARKLLRSVRSQEIIYKPIGHGVLEDEKGTVVFTSITKKDDLSKRREAELRIAPGIFQEYIPKAYEVRVTVVGNDVFAVRIDSQNSKKTRVDWRQYDFANVTHSIEILPDIIHQRCIQLVQKLGLHYGAIDLIVTPKNEWIFLENNCNGQWLWLEKLTGLKISDAIASFLVSLDAIKDS